MGNYNLLKSQIVNDIRTNTNEEITGDLLQERLLDMVESLGAGYQYMGVATPTNPGTDQSPDYNCFYIASTPGTYGHLGGLTVADGEVAILKYNGSWTKEVTGAATAAQVTQLGQKVYWKVEVNPGDNLINPNEIIAGYGIKPNGTIGVNNDLKTTGFIKANGQNIISNGFGGTYWGTGVYDENYNFIRFVNSRYYTYQSGDAYVRFSILTTQANPMANYGSVEKEYVPYDPVGGYVADFVKKSKIVTQFGATPSNDNIPSEKLVKDTLDSEVIRVDDLTDTMTLYQSDSVIASNGTIVSATGYKLYKLELSGLSNRIYYHIKTSGQYISLIYGYDANDNPVKNYFYALSGHQEAIGSFEPIEESQEGVSYILFCESSNKEFEVTQGAISKYFTDSFLEKDALSDFPELYQETKIDVSPNAQGDDSLLNILFGLMTSPNPPSEKNRYYIQLSEGEYDMDSSALSFADNKGIFLMPYTTLVGNGKGVTKLVFRYTGNDDTVMSRFSPLNTPYTCTVKGLSIIAKNVRYAVHSDGPMTGGNANNATILFENVELIHEGFAAGLTPTFKTPYAWGGGSYSNGHLTFKNCDFISYESGAFGNHDHIDIIAPSVFDFENCNFISYSYPNSLVGYNGVSVLFTSWGSGITNYANFRNCRYNKAVGFFVDTSYVSDCKVDYSVLFDNEPIVGMSTDNDTDKDYHYSTGSSIKLLFSNTTQKGKPIMESALNRGAVYDGTNVHKCVGILTHNVAANGLGNVQCKGYIPMQLILGTTFTAGTLIGWNGSSWVEDNDNPILCAINSDIAKFI